MHTNTAQVGTEERTAWKTRLLACDIETEPASATGAVHWIGPVQHECLLTPAQPFTAPHPETCHKPACTETTLAQQ